MPDRAYKDPREEVTDEEMDQFWDAISDYLCGDKTRAGVEEHEVERALANIAGSLARFFSPNNKPSTLESFAEDADCLLGTMTTVAQDAIMERKAGAGEEF